MVNGVVVRAVQETVCCELPHEYSLELVLPVQSEHNLCSNPFFKQTHTFQDIDIDTSFFQIAFAEHQKKMATLHGISEKCTGIKKIEWTDSLRGEFLQQHPHFIYFILLHYFSFSLKILLSVANCISNVLLWKQHK